MTTYIAGDIVAVRRDFTQSFMVLNNHVITLLSGTLVTVICDERKGFYINVLTLKGVVNLREEDVEMFSFSPIMRK